MESVLKQYFGFSKFRLYQKEIIEEVLKGRDALVIMATGSGKSLCYQVPPLVTGKTAVVISPLISLMQDQVMSLSECGIKAQFLGSAQKDGSAYADTQNGYFHIVYMTPEKACAVPSSFWSNMLEKGVCLMAIDEAHCVSEWGHDFRKEYKQLSKLRKFLSHIPFIALTATATVKVREDIADSLNMLDPYVVIGSFDRTNLYYGVVSSARNALLHEEIVGVISKYSNNGSSSIIYCTTIKDTEEIFQLLKDAGLSCGIYHGQMPSKDRERSHRLFVRDELVVMVATVAFGMGIDKPNIRCVIHFGCPKSLEAYYQESGRCGRDGLPSKCFLYYSRADFTKADFYCSEAETVDRRVAIMESYRAAQQYCSHTGCRRAFLLNYFGETFSGTNCGKCDNCVNSVDMERDVTREALLLLTCVKSCGDKWGINMPIDILRGSRSKKIVENHYENLPLHGLGKGHSANWWKGLCDQLISREYLTEIYNDHYRIVRVSKVGVKFLSAAGSDESLKLVMRITPEMAEEDGSGSRHNFANQKTHLAQDFEGLSEDELKLHHMLVDLRLVLAEKSGTAPYAVCGDQTINKLVRIRPSTQARLANIDGVNQYFVSVYGDEVLRVISSLSKELKLSLDGAVPSQVSPAENAYTGSRKKLAPAKMEAWKMWQADGLSFNTIANLPKRAAPIKEGTVAEYIMEAAREGFEVNWTRFCEEIELTYDIFIKIQGAIDKVGSTDKLKPIKDELPESLTYAQIKACLTMLAKGVPVSEIFHSAARKHENQVAQVIVPSSVNEQELNGSTATQTLCKDADDTLHGKENEAAPQSLNSTESKKQPRNSDREGHETPAKTRCKGRELPGRISAPEATNDTVLEWLQARVEASLGDATDHFTGSTEECVKSCLDSLESTFLIFKKNNLYRLM